MVGHSTGGGEVVRYIARHGISFPKHSLLAPQKHVWSHSPSLREFQCCETSSVESRAEGVSV